MEEVFLKNVQDYIRSQIPLLLEQYAAENNALAEKNKMLEAEVARLQALLASYESTPEPVPPEIDSLNWLTNFKDALIQHDQATFQTLISHLPKDIDALQHITDAQAESLTATFMTIFSQTHTFQTNVLQFLLEALTTYTTHHENALTSILDSNPQLIQSLKKDSRLFHLKCNLMMRYETRDEAKAYFVDTLLFYYEDIAQSLEPEQFSQLFWYAFILDEEYTFLQVYSNRKEWLAKNATTALYSKVMERDYNALDVYKGLLSSANLLSETFLAAVFRKIDLIASPYQAKTYFSKDHLYIVNDDEIKQFEQAFTLKADTIQMELFKPHTSIDGKVFSFEVLMNAQTSEAYMSRTRYEQYVEEIAPYVLPASNRREELSNDAPAETSDREPFSLETIHYHYGLDTTDRWVLLQRAVQQFGIQRVAYALGTALQQQKAKKSYSPAIRIWESDLKRLKTNYFKKDFEWPKVE